MSIRSIVTMGYSNGTFSIGTKFIPTMGYLISTLVDVGPGKFVNGQIYKPEFKQGQNFRPEYKQGEVFNPGFQQAQRDC